MTLKQKKIVQDSVLQLNKKNLRKILVVSFNFHSFFEERVLFWNVTFFISLD